MGVIQLSGRYRSQTGISVPSRRVELVFNEFLRRYEELRRLKKKEVLWFSVLGGEGLLLFLAPVYKISPDFSLAFVSVVSCLFIYALIRYFNANRQVEHLKVNVAILRHHLVGLMEVGFCEHPWPCSCAEKFRQDVWNRYHISLYS